MGKYSFSEINLTLWSSFSMFLCPTPITSIFIDLWEKLDQIYNFKNIYNQTRLLLYGVVSSQLKFYYIFSDVLIYFYIYRSFCPSIHQSYFLKHFKVADISSLSHKYFNTHIINWSSVCFFFPFFLEVKLNTVKCTYSKLD